MSEEHGGDWTLWGLLLLTLLTGGAILPFLVIAMLINTADSLYVPEYEKLEREVNTEVFLRQGESAKRYKELSEMQLHGSEESMEERMCSYCDLGYVIEGKCHTCGETS